MGLRRLQNRSVVLVLTSCGVVTSGGGNQKEWFSSQHFIADENES